MTVPRKTGRVSDGGMPSRGPGSDSVGDRGIGRHPSQKRGPGPDKVSPESDILRPKR